MRQVLKYPGSKWNIASEIDSLIPEHHSYVEPFFGSGAVFFKKEPSAIETINDLDSDVTNLFRCIKEDSGKLASMLTAIPYSREVYEEQYTLAQNITEPYEKAVSFLVRCWQGHGFRTNNYRAGWKNDVQGRENMYALWNWYRLPVWVMEIAERLRCVQIENRPALEVIQRFNYSNVFMYLDPPYLLSIRYGKQYKHEMTETDHITLLEQIVQSKAKIMISGYESELYNSYLAGWNKVELTSCAEYGGNRKEVLWMNYEKDCQMSLLSDFPEVIP